MRWLTWGLLAFGVCGAAPCSEAAPRAVVELFTSPFCSACPPADELFVELADHPELITLVMPVDSWDRPGRKDALAKPAFTDRQIAYAERRNEDYLYTPQAMINGAVPADGSDRTEIGDAVAQTAGALSVPVKAAPVGQDIVVSVGAAKSGAARGATLTVLPFVARRSLAMGRTRITYANLVRDIVPVGRWSGKPLTQRLALKDYAQYDGIVVLLQAGTPEKPGAIIGAARIAFGPKQS